MRTAFSSYWPGIAALSMGCAALAASPALADIQYSYDDGTMDSAVGPPSSFPVNPQTGWGNYFVAEPGAEWITSISVAFGPTFAAGREVTVWLFNDPDNDFDPRNAVPLVSTTMVPGTLGGSVFNTFPITPTQVSGGFFVAALAFTERGVDRPAAEDTSARSDRSWLIYNPASVGINVGNLGANAYIARTDSALPFPGAWMIRANGSAVPGPGTALIAALGGLAAVRRKRR
ncbi:MAG: hypothetical protein KF745_04535 [Phycisphaeraceae bacterium]|nr:hypothetical protein [Phycisphaeraceae bacterium]